MSKAKIIEITNTGQLSASEIKFSNLIAKGYSLTEAYRQSFPEKKSVNNDTVRRYASELSMKSEIITEVATSKHRQARLARLAEERIEQQLTEGKDGKVTSDVAMFMYDHANGKATQKVQHTGAFVSVNYDLSGGQAPEIPQEIIDQLKEEK